MGGQGPEGRRPCWCGDGRLTPFGPDHLRCATCGTLVSREGAAGGPPGEDGPAPAVHRLGWLRTLLASRPPPARVLYWGGDGADLLRLAGYEVSAVEPGATPGGAPASYDLAVLDGVLELLPEPLAAVEGCGLLLAPGGLFVVGTVEFPEWETYDEMLARRTPFLGHGLRGGGPYRFSRRALRQLFRRLGYPCCRFETAGRLVCVASRDPVACPAAGGEARLAGGPADGLLRCALDLADRVASLEQANEELAGAAEGARHLVDLLAEQRVACERLAEQLAICESDRAARLEVIHKLDSALKATEAELAALRARPPWLLRWPARVRRLPGKVARLLRGRESGRRSA